MIGLEYIVKLYNGTYKKLAEKLAITPSTVTDWLSKRRPIPKAKLEALSKLFNLEAEYFQKELTKIEEIELRLDYLNRSSKRDSFEIPDYFTDTDGNEHEYTRSIDPYQEEKRMIYDELKIEKIILTLQGDLYHELYDPEQGNKAYEILERASNVLNESVPNNLDAEQQLQWYRKHDKRIEALRSMMYFMDITGFAVWDEEEESFHNELFKLLKKHDLLWMKE
ncbi:helix-turn-helix transcriptional regulator [Paenibacillus sp. LHD-38]|uniref:helix-turn-helix domain-containing protein n=1 Tax=Paenibacillus sp. LHD-38 TaxID=3072143 RepID=UPI00280FD68E|nr:helix-turn-helix transcriptional regulator [Paenibacillus sp. LHD-38]MDQ8734834.1 helix-turn-helix transcriptional regulator [Paenibacillus sp. LHD-38]